MSSSNEVFLGQKNLLLTSIRTPKRQPGAKLSTAVNRIFCLAARLPAQGKELSE